MAGEVPITLVLGAVVLVVALVAGGLVLAHRKGAQAREERLARAGFAACPEEKATLEATVARIMNDRSHRYTVREPRRLAGANVYHYVKAREARGDEQPHAGEELLLRARRRAPSGVVLFVKPTSLAPGLATRLISAVATGAWDTQPDDLERIELPPELKDTNLLGALGPRGASFHDLVDGATSSVVQGLGDAGAMVVRLRDEWCVVEAAQWKTPFQVEELVARLRPLL